MEIEESKTFLPSDEQNDKQLKIIDAGFQDNRGWQSYLQEGWVINNIQLQPTCWPQVVHPLALCPSMCGVVWSHSYTN